MFQQRICIILLSIIKSSTVEFSQEFCENGNAYLIDSGLNTSINPVVECSFIFADDIAFKNGYARFVAKDSGKMVFLM